ncbi:SDR family NAD(P)-dependent oxidoreductase [Streptomyces javensis]|uniref:SDR family NAD(P)-dependent oxidoreductase n=1 Tax=Streptomyces javensis TaxID=114698 RepID=UPI00340A4A94
MTARHTPRGLLVLGGSSEIGLAVAERWVRAGTAEVVLAGRESARLRAGAARLEKAGARVRCVHFDAERTDTHDQVVADALADHTVDAALIAFGVLADEHHPAAAARAVRTNYAGAVSCGLALAERFAGRGHGTIVVLSSVAGVRARPDNLVYGSSKAGLDAFAEGLSHRYGPRGVRVTTVRPGFVTTRLTAGLPPAPFATDVDTVARAVVEGTARGAHVVWVPRVLRWVMTAFRLLPRRAVRLLSR